MIDSTSNVNSSNAFNQFSSGNDITSNKQFLVNAYGSSPQLNKGVLYYNDEKQAQKTKIKKRAILITTAIATLAAAGAIITSAVSGKNLSKLLDPEHIKEIGDNVTQSTIYKKAASFMANINPVKDDAFERLADGLKEKNIPILKHLKGYCDGTKKLYRNILYNSQKKTYDAAVAVIKKEQPDLKIDSFDEWFKKVNCSILDILKGNNGQKHFTKGIFNKEILNKMTESNIADDILFADKGFREIASNITTDAKLSENAKNALDSLNKTRNTITAKLRDINAGSAATDFVTMGVSTAGLGVAMATAEDNKERKSIGVNLGIPILSALSCNFIGNIKGIAGAKSLIFGLAVGQVASRTAKLIDKKIFHKNDLVDNQNV